MKKLFHMALIVGMMTHVNATAAVQSLGIEGAWEGIVDKERNTCYMVSFPVNVQGNFTLRDPSYVIVSIRPGENVIGEVAYNAGYPYHTEKVVTFKVDDKNYNLYPQGEWAWTDGPQNDASILKGFIEGQRLVVQGYSRRGTLTTDTYSLTGVTATWNKTKRACGV